MASTIRSDFSIDTSSLKALARDLEKVSPGIKKEVTVALREGAVIVGMEAKGLSSWSSRIPGSVRVVGSGARVMVRAGGAKAPHAAVFEHRGVPGDFRHPVFGNRENWAVQRARPFLTPALEHKDRAIVDRIVVKLDTLFVEAGFR